MHKSFNLLTGLRGILALWVLFHHIKLQLFYLAGERAAEIADWGYIAVDFFFVLSGFVLAMTHQKEFSANFSYTNLKLFYVKRFARIYPLHLAVLFLYLILPAAYLLTGRDFSWTGKFEPSGFLMSLALVNNWGFQDVLSWNVPSWSISTEFASYILFPFITFLLYRVKNRLVLLSVLISSCILIAFTFFAHNETNIGANIPSLGIWRCIFEFILGMVLFDFFRDGTIKHIGKKNLLFALLIVLIAGVNFDIPDYFWIPLFMFCFIGFCICIEDSFTIRVPRAFIWLGDISYSVYLTHFLIRDVMKLFLPTEQASWLWVATYLAVVLISSHFIYNYYELPAKRKILSKYKNNIKSVVK